MVKQVMEILILYHPKLLVTNLDDIEGCNNNKQASNNVENIELSIVYFLFQSLSHFTGFIPKFINIYQTNLSLKGSVNFIQMCTKIYGSNFTQYIHVGYIKSWTLFLMACVMYSR